MALIKQVQFKGIDESGNIFCQPLLGGLEKTASAESSRLHPNIQDFVRTVRPTKHGIYVLVNALGAGEYWGSNVNGDLFPEKGLIHAPSDWEKMPVTKQQSVGKNWEYGFPTFMGAYPYKHHANKDPSRAFGRVELAVWNPHMHRVELVVYLDRELCKKFDAYDIIERIERGEFPDVSMGCKVPYDTCTICQNRSKTRSDYCEHALTMMNKILPDGRKVAVSNDFPKFFDISFVFIGADKTAKVMAKLAQRGSQICMGEFCTTPRLSSDVGKHFSTEAPVELPYENPKEKTAGCCTEKTAAPWRDDAEYSPEQIEKARIVLRNFAKQANDPIKEKIEVQGVPVWIEWKKGETRLYKKGKVVKYERLMKAPYGYIPGTKDTDGEEIDVYVGPDPSAPTAYVINQLKKEDGSFDEHKVMLGYTSEQAARDSYDYHMGGTKEFFGGIKPVSVSALRALFGDNGEGAGEEKKASHACPCERIGTASCCFVKDTTKLANAVFGITAEKSASHAKLSELIKSIPAGPFSRETLPKLENSERDIPRDVLDLMGGLPLSDALSTPSMMGMVLKPREFQRIILVRIGERPLADELDDKNMTFGHSDEIDDSVPTGADHVDSRLKELLSCLGLLRDRSAAAPALARRVAKSSQKTAPESKISEEPVLKKIAAAYNGYRRSILKKAAAIQQFLTTDPQLRADLFGGSMAQAFAGGIDKVSSASVFGPDSLAYLVGAYTDRDFHVASKEVVASLAQTGAVLEAA